MVSSYRDNRHVSLQISLTVPLACFLTGFVAQGIKDPAVLASMPNITFRPNSATAYYDRRARPQGRFYIAASMYTGPYGLMLMVSDTADPSGNWTTYPIQTDPNPSPADPLGSPMTATTQLGFSKDKLVIGGWTGSRKASTDTVDYSQPLIRRRAPLPFTYALLAVNLLLIRYIFGAVTVALAFCDVSGRTSW